MNANLKLMQGVDDILAMLLAFSAKADELEVLLVSVTFGNVAVERYVCDLYLLRGW
jgi:inosine-uridine nucleoside N-ribohydrolase